MKIAGIVAEYNPFHSGHAYQIARTREELGEDTAIVAVMSGNWVQQADCAVADKWVRAEMAMRGGVDLVLELPSAWALSSAEHFAWGAMSILEHCGVVDVLSFGSECGDIAALQRVADCLNGSAYELELKKQLAGGEAFAPARQKAVEQLLGRDGQLLGQANNNLGISYLCALQKLGSGIRPMTVLRAGAAHNSSDMQAEHLSATRLRAFLREGNVGAAEQYVPMENCHLLPRVPEKIPCIDRVERAMLAAFRTMCAEDWGRLPDSGDAHGLTKRLERAGHAARSLEEFYALAGAKQYTNARIRRLTLWAYLGMKSDSIPNEPPYIRVLGSTPRGREVLRGMKKTAGLPIVTKPAHAKLLTEEGRMLFALESRCTDLYDLCLQEIPAPGREWTTNPVTLGEGTL